MRFAITGLLFLFCCLGGQSVWAFENSHLFDDAIRKNDPEAQYTLAHLYLKGKGGIEFDVEEGIRLLESAAAEEHKEAAFDLALLYLNGTKVRKNDKTALLWLTRAADLGQTDACYFLGMAYRKSDMAAAVKWLRKAKADGHQDASQELQRICREDPGLCRQAGD